MDVLDFILKIAMATYTICLPILISWLHQLRADKKTAHTYMETSMNELSTKIDVLAESVKNIEEKQKYNEAMTSRYRIIRAVDDIKIQGELSDDAVEQLGEDMEIYKTYCNNHPEYSNHKGQNSMKILLEYEKKKNMKIINESEV